MEPRRARGLYQESLPKVVYAIVVCILCITAIGGDIYIVKKHDSLWVIAKRYGVSVDALATFNAIKSKNRIFPGQRLTIPPKKASSTLTTEVRTAIERPTIKPKRWKYIVIHHSATSRGSIKAMDEYHREKRHMENGLAYHFVIGNGFGLKDGEIYIGDRWKRQLDGGHVKGLWLNSVSIGICLVGNFDLRKPTKKQLASLKALTSELLDLCDLKVSAVRSHQVINRNHTRCPGKYFPEATLIKELKAER